jgi:hypothetical protein
MLTLAIVLVVNAAAIAYIAYEVFDCFTPD